MIWYFHDSFAKAGFTGLLNRMLHRKWRETKQHPSRATSGHQITCRLVSLHFLCDILSSHSVHYRDGLKGGPLVARNFSLALPGCCLVKQVHLLACPCFGDPANGKDRMGARKQTKHHVTHATINRSFLFGVDHENAQANVRVGKVLGKTFMKWRPQKWKEIMF